MRSKMHNNNDRIRNFFKNLKWFGFLSSFLTQLTKDRSCKEKDCRPAKDWRLKELF